MPRGQKREKSRRDAACTVCRGTRQLQFPQQAGVEAVVAGLGGEEVGLGKQLVSAGAFFCEMLHRRIRQGSWWPFLFAREFSAER